MDFGLTRQRIRHEGVEEVPKRQLYTEEIQRRPHVKTLSCGQGLSQSITGRHDDMPEGFRLLLQTLPHLCELLYTLFQ